MKFSSTGIRYERFTRSFEMNLFEFMFIQIVEYFNNLLKEFYNLPEMPKYDMEEDVKVKEIINKIMNEVYNFKSFFYIF
jgi:hypothetical protein